MSDKTGHVVERTHLTKRSAMWAPIMGLEKWYRCTVCGALSSAPFQSNCKASDE